MHTTNQCHAGKQGVLTANLTEEAEWENLIFQKCVPGCWSNIRQSSFQHLPYDSVWHVLHSTMEDIACVYTYVCMCIYVCVYTCVNACVLVHVMHACFHATMMQKSGTAPRGPSGSSMNSATATHTHQLPYHQTGSCPPPGECRRETLCNWCHRDLWTGYRLGLNNHSVYICLSACLPVCICLFGWFTLSLPVRI